MIKFLIGLAIGLLIGGSATLGILSCFLASKHEKGNKRR